MTATTDLSPLPTEAPAVAGAAKGLERPRTPRRISCTGFEDEAAVDLAPVCAKRATTATRAEGAALRAEPAPQILPVPPVSFAP